MGVRKKERRRERKRGMAEREKKRKKREKTERGGDKGKVSRVERATGRQRQTESIERPREHSEKVREREVVAKSFMKFLLPRYIRVTIKSRSAPPTLKRSGPTFFCDLGLAPADRT